ncbi:MAG: type II secretion system F family protein [Betaproteobacteria bacterium]|nr:MAG: type II secretion system F family protein [Betaproteobacteria bacterium]
MFSHTPQMLVGIGLLVGASVALVLWVALRAIADVPAEDRTWRDRPPSFIRCVWWPTRVLAHWIGRLLPIALRQRMLVRMRIAGLDYALSPAQLIAHRVVIALLSGAFAGWLAYGWQAHEPLLFALLGSGVGFLIARSWFADRVAARRRQLLKTLPFFLDLITLCVEAGLNLTGAFQQAVAKGPDGPLRDEFQRVLRDVRAGKSRADALRTFGDRLNEPSIAHLVSAIIQAENLGMSLGPLLRAQSEQRRCERFARAEKAAMEAPVKLLFPLVAFIFPCTFLVIGFPIVVQFMRMGL